MRKVHETGESVTVTSHGRPLVRIESVRDAEEPQGYGCMQGTFELLVSEDEAFAPRVADWGTLEEWKDGAKR